MPTGCNTSGLDFGLMGRWRLHIVAPDPDPGPISDPLDLPEQRKRSAAGGVRPVTAGCARFSVQGWAPDRGPGRRWLRPRNRFRSTTAGIIPAASTSDSCLLLVMPGLVPLLSGSALAGRAQGPASTGFRGVRRDRGPDRRPRPGPQTVMPAPHIVMPGLVPGISLHRFSRDGRMDARNKSGHDGRGRPERRASKPEWVPVNDRWYESEVEPAGMTPAQGPNSTRPTTTGKHDPADPAPQAQQHPSALTGEKPEPLCRKPRKPQNPHQLSPR